MKNVTDDYSEVNHFCAVTKNCINGYHNEKPSKCNYYKERW